MSTNFFFTVISRKRLQVGRSVLLLWWGLALVAGCAVVERQRPSTTSGLIITPVSYYSTPKARLLGEKYKSNLDRLVERIVRNPKTVGLQFANNIASVGGIGFFTHSATALPDERYLEVVLAAPELFETGDDASGKLHRLFALYGTELLAVLSSDSDVYLDRDVAGYGVNLSWRKLTGGDRSPKVVVERAVVYFSKVQAQRFVRRELSQNELLKSAIVFAGENDGPLALVSIAPRETAADYRPPIKEEILADSRTGIEPQPPVAKPAVLPSPIQPEPSMKTTAPRLPTPEGLPAQTEAPPAPSIVIVQTPLPADERDGTIPRRDLPIEKTTEPTKPTVSPEPVAKPVEVKIPPMPVPVKTDGGGTPDAPVLILLKPPAAAKEESEPREMTKPEPRLVLTASLDPFQDPPAKLTLEPNLSKRASDELPIASKTTEIARAEKSPPLAETKPIEAPVIPSPSPREPGPRLPDVAKASDKSARPVDSASAALPRSSSVGTGESMREPVSTPITARDVPAAESEPTADNSIGQFGTQAQPAEHVVSTLPQNRPTPENIHPAQPANVAANETKKKPAQPTAPTNSRSTAKAAVPQSPSPAPPQESRSTPASVTSEEVQASAAGSNNPTTLAKDFSADNLQESPAVPMEPPPPLVAPVETRSAPVVLPPPASNNVTAVIDIEPAKSPDLSITMQQTPVSQPLEPVVAAKTVSNPAQNPAPPLEPAPRGLENKQPEQLASLSVKADPPIVERRSVPRPAPKALSGYIVQIAFSDAPAAQRWAESMERRGFAVSVTEAGDSGAVRVRLGNFGVRDEAERQLRSLRQQGMQGIVLNLPQAFRPEAAASLP